jgi:cytoskeleton protein RodZ
MRDIGSILREGRKARGLELSEVARKTCINSFYLKALEEGRFHVVPKVFDRGYLKIYAKLLGLDVPNVMSQYEQERNRIPSPSDHVVEARSA